MGKTLSLTAGQVNPTFSLFLEDLKEMETHHWWKTRAGNAEPGRWFTGGSPVCSYSSLPRQDRESWCNLISHAEGTRYFITWSIWDSSTSRQPAILEDCELIPEAPLVSEEPVLSPILSNKLPSQAGTKPFRLVPWTPPSWCLVPREVQQRCGLTTVSKGWPILKEILLGSTFRHSHSVSFILANFWT